MDGAAPTLARELRMARLRDACDGVAIATPAGTVLFRSAPGGPGGLAELLPAPAQRLPPPLLGLVRRQWARRPEADALFCRVGPRLLLARAQAQPAEQPQVVVTLIDATGARDRLAPLESGWEDLTAERRQLARELHDVVGQRLATLIVHLECDLRERLADLDRTREYRDELRSILGSVRRVHQDLRWTPIGGSGLLEAIRSQVVPSLQRARCRVRLESLGWPVTFPAEDAFQVLRLVQEASANVVRHARATRAVIRLDGEADCALVSVNDNGVGFEPRAAGDPPRSGGLTGMRERAALIGGDLQVVSTPGLGTTVSLVVPLHG